MSHDEIPKESSIIKIRDEVRVVSCEPLTPDEAEAIVAAAEADGRCTPEVAAQFRVTIQRMRLERMLPTT